MTLHEAIKLVLLGTTTSLSAEEIAFQINKRSLYQRKDDKLVPPSQIIVRAKKYDDLFFVREEKINLKNRNRYDQELEIIKKFFKDNLVEGSPHEKIDFMEGFLNYQQERLLEKEKEKKDPSSRNIIEEPSSSNLLREDEKKSENKELAHELHLADDVFNWAFKEEKDAFPVLPKEIGRIIAGLKIYKPSNRIYLYSNLIWNFLFPLYSQNLSSDWQVQKLTNHENPRLKNINEKISSFLNRVSPNKEVKNDEEHIAILAHKGFQKQGHELPEEFSFFAEKRESLDASLNKLVLIVPEASLYNDSPKYIEARKILLGKKNLKGIFSLPKYGQSNINFSLLLFDFAAPSHHIYFADFTKEKGWEPNEINAIINGIKHIKNVTRTVVLEKIAVDSYDLQPKKFVIDPYDFRIQEGKKVYLLKNLLREYKRGVNKMDSGIMYAGGEIKYIRTSDLNPKEFPLIISNKIVGVDHDELEELKISDNLLVTGGVAVSTIGKNLKATLLPNNEIFILDKHLFWLEPDETMVLSKFLVNELSMGYVQKQVDYFSTGMTVPYLKKDDLLNIKIQIPVNIDDQESIIEEVKEDHTLNYKVQIEELQKDKDNFIKILKHTLKQRIGSLSGDFRTLATFLKEKSNDQKTVSFDDITVPAFPEDKKEDLENFKLINVLSRMDNALSLSHEILEKAENILELRLLEKEKLNLKDLIKNVAKGKPQIRFQISGEKATILADKSLFTIMFNNFFENAEKHGEFEQMAEKGIIALELLHQQNDLIIEIRNNGKRMAPDFTIEDFLSNGKSKGGSGGNGFGGYLIGEILKKHNGKVDLIDSKELSIFNVGFRLTIPKS